MPASMNFHDRPDKAVLRRPLDPGQYTSRAFTQLCRRNRIRQSMSRSGTCLDNAAGESFFASLKTELVYRIVLATKAVARRELIAWFDRYNRLRRHSHCYFRSPITYEKMTRLTSRCRVTQALHDSRGGPPTRRDRRRTARTCVRPRDHRVLIACDLLASTKGICLHGELAVAAPNDCATAWSTPPPSSSATLPGAASCACGKLALLSSACEHIHRPSPHTPHPLLCHHAQ
jgi:hypothetical protein